MYLASSLYELTSRYLYYGTLPVHSWLLTSSFWPYTTVGETSVVDPDRYWIRIQEPSGSGSGSVFRIRIRIYTCKHRLKWRKYVRFKILINNSETQLIKKISLGDSLFL